MIHSSSLLKVCFNAVLAKMFQWLDCTWTNLLEIFLLCNTSQKAREQKKTSIHFNPKTSCSHPINKWGTWGCLWIPSSGEDNLVAPLLPKTTWVTKSVHHVLLYSSLPLSIVGGRTANTPEMNNAASIKSCGGGKFLLEKTSGRCNRVAATCPPEEYPPKTSGGRRVWLFSVEVVVLPSFFSSEKLEFVELSLGSLSTLESKCRWTHTSACATSCSISSKDAAPRAPSANPIQKRTKTLMDLQIM